MQDQQTKVQEINLNHWCPACQEEKAPNEFLSDGIDGWGEIRVCISCWNSFTPFERILLDIIARQSFEGGIAPYAQLNSIEAELEKISRLL